MRKSVDSIGEYFSNILVSGSAPNCRLIHILNQIDYAVDGWGCWTSLVSSVSDPSIKPI